MLRSKTRIPAIQEDIVPRGAWASNYLNPRQNLNALGAVMKSIDYISVNPFWKGPIIRDRQNRAAQRARTRANESNEPTSLGIVETRATSLGIVQRA